MSELPETPTTMFTVHYLCRPYFSFKLLLLSPPGLFQLGICLQVNDLHASFGNSDLKLKSNLLLYLTLTLLQYNLLKVLEFFPI